MHVLHSRKGCLVAMVACVPCVLCWVVMPFGDRMPPRAVVPTNRTARSLYVRFDSGRGSVDEQGDLPVDFGRGYRPSAWDRPQVGIRYRVRVYSSEFSERPICERDLTPEIANWKHDIPLSVEPAGEGCRIVIGRNH